MLVAAAGCARKRELRRLLAGAWQSVLHCGSNSGGLRASATQLASHNIIIPASSCVQAAGAQQYVLDIRSNGGGLFPSGVEVARMWITKGDVVLIADR